MEMWLTVTILRGLGEGEDLVSERATEQCAQGKRVAGDVKSTKRKERSTQKCERKEDEKKKIKGRCQLPYPAGKRGNENWNPTRQARGMSRWSRSQDTQKNLITQSARRFSSLGTSTN